MNDVLYIKEWLDKEKSPTQFAFVYKGDGVIRKIDLRFFSIWDKVSVMQDGFVLKNWSIYKFCEDRINVCVERDGGNSSLVMEVQINHLLK